MKEPQNQLQKNLTPREIVEALDQYIVGQTKAKRAVAIALRNRWRRQQVPSELRDEISPKNIIMIGPTGVGKTEIARRLAKLAEAPFIKVEATKFTEVGYVGKDVESMVRDLVETAVKMTKETEKKAIHDKAKESAEERLLDLLLPSNGDKVKQITLPPHESAGGIETEPPPDQTSQTREKLRQMFRNGELDKRMVRIKRQESSTLGIDIFAIPAFGDSEPNFKEIVDQIIPKKTKASQVSVPEAFKILIEQEENRLVDMDNVVKAALHRVENSGIIFLDEIDKIAGRESYGTGPQVSREGVQRDLLPIVEGSNVNTKYGVVRTDHILFIAAGAFNVSKPSDLIPELQGRFPIRVELDSLTKEDFMRILVEPANSLTKQYTSLLETERIKVRFERSAIECISELATVVNNQTENIGARRLHTIMEKLFDDLAFDGPEKPGTEVVIDEGYVRHRLAEIVKNNDLSRYIL